MTTYFDMGKNLGRQSMIEQLALPQPDPNLYTFLGMDVCSYPEIPPDMAYMATVLEGQILSVVKMAGIKLDK